MKITFDETIKKKDWLHGCLLNSLTPEAIKSGEKTRSYEVKLLVNGIELEPTLLQDLLSNIEKHIDSEAENLVENKFSDFKEKIRLKENALDEILKEALEKIRTEFNINENE